MLHRFTEEQLEVLWSVLHSTQGVQSPIDLRPLEAQIRKRRGDIRPCPVFRMLLYSPATKSLARETSVWLSPRDPFEQRGVVLASQRSGLDVRLRAETRDSFQACRTPFYHVPTQGKTFPRSAGAG